MERGRVSETPEPDDEDDRGRDRARLVAINRKIYRPRSPIRPGNYVQNALVTKGKNELKNKEGDVEVVEGEDGAYVPPWVKDRANQPPPEEKPKKPQPEPKTKAGVKSDSDWIHDMMHVEKGSGDPRNFIKFGLTQRQEILASLYAPCQGDPVGHRPSPEKKRFIVIDFGIYVAGQYAMLPAEFSITDFNIIDGIQGVYTRLLDPRVIPLGYRGEVKEAMKTNGYLEPGFDPTFEWNKDCLQYIIGLMSVHRSVGDQPGYLYVMPKNYRIVKECLEWISKGLKKEFRFKLMSLPMLVHVLLTEAIHLRSNNRMRSSFAPISEIQVLKLLMDTENDFQPKMACNFHQLPSRERSIQHCTATQVKCRIYNAMKLLTRYYKCTRYVFNHFPKLPKMDVIAEPNLTSKPSLAYLNTHARMSDVSSQRSSVRTGEFLYEARGASSMSMSTDSQSALSCLREDTESEDEQFIDLHTVKKNLGTLETFPRLKLGKEIEKFPIKPDMKDRAFPSAPTPFFSHTGQQQMERCDTCSKFDCICNLGRNPRPAPPPGSANDPKNLSYRRFEQTEARTWNIVEETHQNEEVFGDPDRSDSDTESSVYSESSISPHDSASQVGRTRKLSTDRSDSSSCYESGSELDSAASTCSSTDSQEMLVKPTRLAAEFPQEMSPQRSISTSSTSSTRRIGYEEFKTGKGSIVKRPVFRELTPMGRGIPVPFGCRREDDEFQKLRGSEKRFVPSVGRGYSGMQQQGRADVGQKKLTPSERELFNTMKEWQVQLPASGSAGRGRYVWGLSDASQATAGPLGFSALKISDNRTGQNVQEQEQEKETEKAEEQEEKPEEMEEKPEEVEENPEVEEKEPEEGEKIQEVVVAPVQHEPVQPQPESEDDDGW